MQTWLWREQKKNLWQRLFGIMICVICHYQSIENISDCAHQMEENPKWWRKCCWCEWNSECGIDRICFQFFFSFRLLLLLWSIAKKRDNRKSRLLLQAVICSFFPHIYFFFFLFQQWPSFVFTSVCCYCLNWIWAFLARGSHQLRIRRDELRIENGKKLTKTTTKYCTRISER